MERVGRMGLSRWQCGCRPVLIVCQQTGLLIVALGLFGAIAQATAADEPVFKVGAAERDITPTAPVPMWGYAARHDLLSNGMLDPLRAKALVIVAGEEKLALVGTDLGRGPTRAMMQQIRQALAEKAGIRHVIISGSHSHHGPVIELTDRLGYGQGKYDAAVAYAKRLPELLIEAILEADAAARPARMGIATREINYNRNRHSQRLPKPTDPLLSVLRFDDTSGKLIAVLVNFAAHPTMIDEMILKFSADYPGAMKAKVEQTLGGQCVFMQGAAGDMSANPPEGVSGHVAFGQALADQVIELARDLKTEVPPKPALRSVTDQFRFSYRLDISNSLITTTFGRVFFPELVRNMVEDHKDGLLVEMNTVLLNGEVAIVAGSGEFFANHAVRLRPRVYLPHTLFFGYANDHNMYFPTIEATSEGGYGADPQVSHVELGAGETMMNRALINLYGLMNKVNPKPAKRVNYPHPAETVRVP